MIFHNQQLFYQKTAQNLLPFASLSLFIQQVSLLQLLFTKKKLSSNSLLILEEPILEGQEKAFLDALLILLEQGVTLLINCKQQAFCQLVAAWASSSEHSFPIHIYQGKQEEQGSVFEEHIT